MVKDWFGVLNVDKPAGQTSRETVNRIQRIVRPKKVGHAGTLDPLARGVLLVCVGRATRLVPYLQQQMKRYRGIFQLGKTSDTEDIAGTVQELGSAARPTEAEIVDVLPRFCGVIRQRPPAFSALKVNGRRAYDLARRGETVTLRDRTIFVQQLQLVDYEYPRLVLDIACGSGTYIRSLGRDIAVALGTGAVMSDLTRTAIGSFLVQDACHIDQVTPESLSGLLQPALAAVDHLPRVTLDPGECEAVWHGRQVGPSVAGRDRFEPGQELAAVDRSGELVAILACVDGQHWRPLRTFHFPEQPARPS